jgi:hypothetical protein
MRQTITLPMPPETRDEGRLGLFGAWVQDALDALAYGCVRTIPGDVLIVIESGRDFQKAFAFRVGAIQELLIGTTIVDSSESIRDLCPRVVSGLEGVRVTISSFDPPFEDEAGDDPGGALDVATSPQTIGATP